MPNGVRAETLFRSEGNLRLDFNPLRFDLCNLDGLALQMDRCRFKEIFRRLNSYTNKSDAALPVPKQKDLQFLACT